MSKLSSLRSSVVRDIRWTNLSQNVCGKIRMMQGLSASLEVENVGVDNVFSLIYSEKRRFCSSKNERPWAIILEN